MPAKRRWGSFSMLRASSSSGSPALTPDASQANIDFGQNADFHLPGARRVGKAGGRRMRCPAPP